jgi:hypothetical protein
MPSDLDIFLVVTLHQSIRNNNSYHEQLEHFIHLTYYAKTNMLEEAITIPLPLFGDRM